LKQLLVVNVLINNKCYLKEIIINEILTLGDWGLGIGDWAQSPIPNPQSPIL